MINYAHYISCEQEDSLPNSTELLMKIPKQDFYQFVMAAAKRNPENFYVISL